jgi:hypothetical protein
MRRLYSHCDCVGDENAHLLFGTMEHVNRNSSDSPTTRREAKHGEVTKSLLGLRRAGASHAAFPLMQGVPITLRNFRFLPGLHRAGASRRARRRVGDQAFRMHPLLNFCGAGTAR